MGLHHWNTIWKEMTLQRRRAFPLCRSKILFHFAGRHHCRTNVLPEALMNFHEGPEAGRRPFWSRTRSLIFSTRNAITMIFACHGAEFCKNSALGCVKDCDEALRAEGHSSLPRMTRLWPFVQWESVVGKIRTFVETLVHVSLHSAHQALSLPNNVIVLLACSCMNSKLSWS